MKIIVVGVVALLVLFDLARAKNAEQKKLDPFDQLLEDFVPKLFLQHSFNENGTDSRFEHYALHDHSNEELGKSTMQQIVARSGFKYEDHFVMADDGYLTQITRIINPMADPSQLKQPPVMMLHGGIIDPTVYVWASAIQHHPEPFPRTENSGPMTSWNRSLAFMLANNGYDVWIIGTRGSDTQNQGHVKYKGPKSIDKSGATALEFPLQAGLEAIKYWDFSMDEVIEFELPRQVDKVLSLTGARNVTLVTLSLSTMTVPPFVANYPEYADKVHNLVVIAPIINNKGANLFIKFVHNLVSIIPDEIGNFILSEVLFTRFLRSFILLINKHRYFRYTLVKFASAILTGSSAKYHTLLEPAVVGHIFMPLGFKYFKHYCQQAKHGKLQKYDYGLIKNPLVYGGNLAPPEYKISHLNVENWLLISGTGDNLATPASVRQFVRKVHPKPYKHYIADGFNHLDLVAAFENDIYVNFPILEFLDRFRLQPSNLVEPEFFIQASENEHMRLM